MISNLQASNLGVFFPVDDLREFAVRLGHGESLRDNSDYQIRHISRGDLFTSLENMSTKAYLESLSL
jgi:hypothetical protein